MEYILKEYDIFQNLMVTRVSKDYCFFGAKRMAWSTIRRLLKSGEKIKHKLSPNSIVDWANKQSVIDYYDSFEKWSTYVSMLSSRQRHDSGILEVKDNLVSFQGEYYLPGPTSVWIDDSHMWNAKPPSLPDGKFNINLYKQENTWYPHTDPDKRENITVNFFIASSQLLSAVNELKQNATKIYASQWDSCITFGYEHSVMDGMSFSLKAFDSVRFFEEYYVNRRHSSDKAIDLSKLKIYQIMYPVEDAIVDILRKALTYRKFRIEISTDWGEVSVANSLEFDESVAKEVFEIMNKALRNY